MPLIREPVYNISAPAVVAVNARKLRTYTVQTPGTAGVLTFNDCATVAQASIANQILSIPFAIANGWLSTGLVNPLMTIIQGALNFDWPLLNGLVVSAIPTGMAIAVDYEIYVN